MNRGRRHEDIFYADEDRLTFISLLGEISDKYQVQIHAYCLMDNHYHLLLNTPYPNLQKAMRHLGGVYTQRFNRSHKKEGSLFKGRYKSKLIQSETYLTQVSRYIHLNPVNAKMVNIPEEYEWSSYPSFLDITKKADWLLCDDTLSYFGDNTDSSTIKRYQNYINQGVDNEFLKQSNSAILGSKEFIKSIAIKAKQVDTLDVPDQKLIVQLTNPSLSTIHQTVSNHFKISRDEIKISKQRAGNLPRQVGIYMADKHTSHSHQVIANYFGGTSRYGIARSCHRIRLKSRENLKLVDDIRLIEKTLLHPNRINTH